MRDNSGIDKLTKVNTQTDLQPKYWFKMRSKCARMFGKLGGTIMNSIAIRNSSIAFDIDKNLKKHLKEIGKVSFDANREDVEGYDLPIEDSKDLPRTKEVAVAIKKLFKLARGIIDVHINHQSEILIDHDAILRCAISRAYYSAHCQANKYLNLEGLYWSKDLKIASHQWVINGFLTSSTNRSVPLKIKSDADKLKKIIYNELYFLRDERVLADYKDEYPDNGEPLRIELAEDCIKRSKYALDSLEKLRCIFYSQNNT